MAEQQRRGRMQFEVCVGHFCREALERLSQRQGVFIKALIRRCICIWGFGWQRLGERHHGKQAGHPGRRLSPGARVGAAANPNLSPTLTLALTQPQLLP